MELANVIMRLTILVHCLRFVHVTIQKELPVPGRAKTNYY